jgi:hypothetical protein
MKNMSAKNMKRSSLENWMTKRSGRAREQFTMLKAALLTGSLVATLAGTYLLGRQEPVETATTVSTNEFVTVMMPVDESSAIQLPLNGRGVQIQLKPIAQVVQPRINPVARTRSSR